MRVSAKTRGLVAILAATTFSGLVGCTVVVRDQGPPSHAPAWGYEDSDDYYDDYYYYPSAQVYFHIYTGYYYYRSGHRWIRTRVLPRHIHLHSRDRYRLRTRDREPYRHNEEHRRRYRPRPDLRPDERDDRREREENSRRNQEYRQRKDSRPGDSSRGRDRIGPGGGAGGIFIGEPARDRTRRDQGQPQTGAQEPEQDSRQPAPATGEAPTEKKRDAKRNKGYLIQNEKPNGKKKARKKGEKRDRKDKDSDEQSDDQDSSERNNR